MLVQMEFNSLAKWVTLLHPQSTQILQVLEVITSVALVVLIKVTNHSSSHHSHYRATCLVEYMALKATPDNIEAMFKGKRPMTRITRISNK